SHPARTARTQGQPASDTRGRPAAEAPDPERTLTTASPMRRATRWTFALLGSLKRNGHWRIEGETSAMAILGSCQLDLRRATVYGDEIVVNVMAILGSVKIIVPQGMHVELDGPTILGSQECKLNDDLPPLEIPIV